MNCSFYETSIYQVRRYAFIRFRKNLLGSPRNSYRAATTKSCYQVLVVTNRLESLILHSNYSGIIAKHR